MDYQNRFFESLVLSLTVVLHSIDFENQCSLKKQQQPREITKREMKTIDIDVAYGRINLQCATTVYWTQTFPERIPIPIQPYVEIQMEETWNHFSSHELNELLTSFNKEIRPMLLFHLLTCTFSLFAFLGNVVVAIVFRTGDWREFYPVACMGVVFLVLLITQYRTIKVFKDVLRQLSADLEKALEQTFLVRNNYDKKIKEDRLEKERDSDRNDSDINDDNNIDPMNSMNRESHLSENHSIEDGNKNGPGIISFELIMDNTMSRGGTVRIFHYKVRLHLDMDTDSDDTDNTELIRDESSVEEKKLNLYSQLQ